ncbi:MAG: hypothetical protein WAK55_05800 [Xanthobacteraceae bacterium]
MTNEELLAELDALDIGVIKERIASGAYLQPWKGLAQGYVERKEAAVAAEQMALARQTRWIAVVAVIIAAISLVVAMFK